MISVTNLPDYLDYCDYFLISIVEESSCSVTVLPAACHFCSVMNGKAAAGALGSSAQGTYYQD